VPLWLYWIFFGLVAGALAKFLVPGRDPSGCLFTIILGIVGAMLGGFLGTWFGWGRVTQPAFDLGSIGIAVLGAMILLIVGRLVRRALKRPGKHQARE
jgi:uncharacterized membrane protein YeaQ/YmgE (transglycosylase-associated protein family)